MAPEPEPPAIAEPPTATAPAGMDAGDGSAPTVGTGTWLAVGCLILTVLLVFIAIVARWLGGTW